MMMQERQDATRQQGLPETLPTHERHDAQPDQDLHPAPHSPVREEEEEGEAITSLAREDPDKFHHNLVLPRRLLRPPADPYTTPRNRSPFSRSHLRSRSSGAAFSSAPAMTRAHSSPSPGSTDFLKPQSAQQLPPAQQQQSYQPPLQMRTPARQRSPFSDEHPRPRSPRSWEAGALGIASIQEDVALDIPLSRPLPAPLSRSSGSLRRSRPASPLHSVTNAVGTSNPPAIMDGSGSPMLGPMQRYYSNEQYPSSSSASSVPSTPTSWMSRSRSPSISSLETIEDAGEEVENKEAEAVEMLRQAAEAEGSRRSSFDGGSRMRVGRERKRWSVCGGERRGDLDLETIWED